MPAELDDITVWAGQVVTVKKSFRFTDKISNDLKQEDYCGKLKYTLVEEESMAFIKMLKPLPGSSDDKVTIVVNVAGESSASTTVISVVGELED